MLYHIYTGLSLENFCLSSHEPDYPMFQYPSMFRPDLCSAKPVNK